MIDKLGYVTLDEIYQGVVHAVYMVNGQFILATRFPGTYPPGLTDVQVVIRGEDGKDIGHARAIINPDEVIQHNNAWWLKVSVRLDVLMGSGAW